jgi:LysM repeat protein
MPRRKLYWERLAAFVLVLLTASGCFQAWGGDLVQATDSAQTVPTYTPFPSITPPPTQEPLPTYTPYPTEAEDVLAQSDPLVLLTVQAPPVTVVVQLPTTDPISMTMTAESLAQAQQNLDQYAQTATAWILQATLGPMTQTAAAMGIVAMTPTSQFAQNAAPSQPLIPGQDCTHEVLPGQTLYRIALNYGLTVDDIAIANGILNPDFLAVGQRLTIPRCGTTGVTPLPTSTERATAQPTAIPAQSSSGGSSSGPLAITFTPVPGANSAQTVPSSAAGSTHIVRQGETLFQISMQYGVSVHEIAAANGIANLNLIYIGQQLVIP